MSKTIRMATLVDVQKVDDAIDLLREADKLLREAGAVKARSRVLLALASARGAQRHVWHRMSRSKDAVAAKLVDERAAFAG